jgi:hypothetical protein
VPNRSGPRKLALPSEDNGLAPSDDGDGIALHTDFQPENPGGIKRMTNFPRQFWSSRP